MRAERIFPAMGTTVHIVVDGDGRSLEALLDTATNRIDALERRWSRFIGDSEISRLNASAGAPTIVSDETFTLVTLAVHGWRLTAGAFDPCVLDPIRAAGYDRGFELLDGMVPTRAPRLGDAGSIGLDPMTSAVTLPEGSGFDPGGIGKGLAADIVVTELLGSGARSACVNVGGDLRAEGETPLEVAIEHPGRGIVATVPLDGGAVATTSRRKRTWNTTDGVAHHLIDPATGRPANRPIEGVTVVAGEAWWAEVVAKAAFLAGEQAADTIRSYGETGLVVHDGGRVETLEGIATWTAR